MNNLSLTKISMVVIAATFTTLLVSASDDIATTVQVKDVVVTKQAAKQKAKQANKPMKKQIKFSQLTAQFDTDNNGLLSQSELKASNNQALHIAFNKLDINTDDNISEQEFVAFTNKIKLNK